MTGDAEHRMHRVMIEETGSHLATQLVRRLLGTLGGTRGTWLGQGVIDVCRSQHPRGHWQHTGGQSAMVAGAIQALVVLCGKWSDLPKPAEPRQHTLGIVGMQPNALPLRVRER